ncbi:MAG: acetylserotonin O-methyltransferase [Actinomycetota bacterium]|nr:acetylserotonin O-methyltransferase [Actinomycetota bacterium]
MSDDSAVARLQDIGIGYWKSQALYVAAKLGIADHLRERPKTADELAAEVGAHSPSLFRVLRFLASLGVFDTGPDGAFSLNSLAEPLLTTSQGSTRDWVIMLGEEFYLAWGMLLDTVKDGKDSFRHTFGQGLFEYLARHPEYAKTFDRAMAAGSTFFDAVPSAYDFSPHRTVADVGGGNGAMLAAILTANTALRGVLFDAPSVLESARANLEAQGVLERCELVAGDFFESIVGGGDVYIFSRVLHDWTDEQCVTILENCRRSISPDGRVLIIERLIPGSYAIASDINMLAVTGGRERSREEFASLLQEAGFELLAVTPLPLEAHIVEAAPKR